MPGSIYMLERVHVGSQPRRSGDGPYRMDGGMGGNGPVTAPPGWAVAAAYICQGAYIHMRLCTCASVHICEAESRRPRGGPSWTGDGTGDDGGVYMREHIRAR